MVKQLIKCVVVRCMSLSSEVCFSWLKKNGTTHMYHTQWACEKLVIGADNVLCKAVKTLYVPLWIKYTWLVCCMIINTRALLLTAFDCILPFCRVRWTASSDQWAQLRPGGDYLAYWGRHCQPLLTGLDSDWWRVPNQSLLWSCLHEPDQGWHRPYPLHHRHCRGQDGKHGHQPHTGGSHRYAQLNPHPVAHSLNRFTFKRLPQLLHSIMIKAGCYLSWLVSMLWHIFYCEGAL